MFTYFDVSRHSEQFCQLHLIAPATPPPKVINRGALQRSVSMLLTVKRSTSPRAYHSEAPELGLVLRGAVNLSIVLPVRQDHVEQLHPIASSNLIEPELHLISPNSPFTLEQRVKC